MPAAPGPAVQEARPGTAAEPPAAPIAQVAVAAPPFALERPAPQPAELRAVAADRWSLRVTVGADAKKNLETLIDLLGHKIPRRDLAAVVEEAIRCAAEVYAKRRGAGGAATPRDRVPRARQTAGGPAVPMGVRREVWARDGGRCTFVAADGTRCDSRWRLELDHVEPRALGGPATATNLRLRCRTHNLLHAEAVFGVDHMARYRRVAQIEAGQGTAASGHALDTTGGAATRNEEAPRAG